MNIKEYFVSSALIIFIAAIFAYAFYESIIAFIVFLIPMYFYNILIKKWLNKRRLHMLTVEFKDFCQSLSAQLTAGYSIENAMIEVYHELSQIYGSNADICVEIKSIISKMKINITIENCLSDFADRCEIEDIKLFSEVINSAKRKGGDIINIVKSTSNSICKKIEVEREIKSIINSKKYEQSIMNIVPIFIICYVKISSPNMISIMYESYIGRVIMTIALIVYIFAFLLGMKLSNIEI